VSTPKDDLIDVVVGSVIVVLITTVWAFSMPIHVIWSLIFFVTVLLGTGLVVKGWFRIIRRLR